MARRRSISSVQQAQHRPARRTFRQRAEAYRRPALVAGTILLLLLPMFLAYYFRAPTASLPATDAWARSTVESNLRNQVSASIAQQYPNLPAQNRQQLIDEQLAQVLAENQAQIDQQVEQTAAYFRSQLQDPDGHTYLPDLDTYHWMRLIENVLDHGYAADIVLPDGRYWDTHMIAPIGLEREQEFYTWFVAKAHEVVRVFSPDTNPRTTFFWIPVLFAVLSVIPAFFIGRREGLIGAFFAAMMIATHPSVIGRTAAGFADTDMVVVFFPLLVGWFLIEMLETPAWRWGRLATWTVLLGLAFGLFAWAWNWWFFFDVMLLALVAHFVFVATRALLHERDARKALRDETVRWSAIGLAGFVISSGIFVSLISSPSDFVRSPLSAFGSSTTFKDAALEGQIWPNVMTTVAELNEPGLAQIVDSLGGKLLFFVALMGVFFSLVPKEGLRLKDAAVLGFGAMIALFLVSGRGLALPIVWFLAVMGLPVVMGALLLLKDGREVDVKYAFILIFWLAASIFTMTKGVRFVLLIVPPFAIAAATTISRAYSLAKDWLVRSAEFSERWVAPTLFLLLCLPLVPVAAQGREAGMQGVPTMTDAWWDSLTGIKDRAAPDAIINSWWDFGHWFKYVGDRAVTFDGASQHGELAHWIGRALITSDEKETMAILRMVDCGSDTGAAKLQSFLPSEDQYEAIMLTKAIILMKHADARRLLLEKGVDSAQADEVLALTHCDPPENYFITSSDMIGKAGVWGHFGSWDFARADALKAFKDRPQADAVAGMTAKYGWSEAEATKRYLDMQTLPNEQAVNAWISPWPGYLSSNWGACSPSGDGLVLCQFGLRLGEQNGAITVLEGLVLNTTNVSNSFLSIGFYNAQNQKLGANYDVKPNALRIYAGNESERYELTGQLFGQSFVVDLDDGRALMLEGSHLDSLFARLYFLDGKDTVAFEKFSDKSDFMGNRIVVWKVDWSKLEELGLE